MFSQLQVDTLNIDILFLLFKWVLWDIPTNAEWSFQYLRRKAQETREKLIEGRVESQEHSEKRRPPMEHYTGHLNIGPQVQVEGDTLEADSMDDSDDSGFYTASSSASILDSSDIRSFRAYYDGVPGRLIVFSDGIRFVRSLKKKEIWRHDFIDLMEMRKMEGSRISRVPSSHVQMEITCIDGSRLRLKAHEGEGRGV